MNKKPSRETPPLRNESPNWEYESPSEGLKVTFDKGVVNAFLKEAGLTAKEIAAFKIEFENLKWSTPLTRMIAPYIPSNRIAEIATRVQSFDGNTLKVFTNNLGQVDKASLTHDTIHHLMHYVQSVRERNGIIWKVRRLISRLPIFHMMSRSEGEARFMAEISFKDPRWEKMVTITEGPELKARAIQQDWPQEVGEIAGGIGKMALGVAIEAKQRLLRRDETRAIIDYLDPNSTDSTLEMGVNQAGLLEDLHERNPNIGENYTILDKKISPIARMRAKNAEAQVLECDAANTGKPDASYKRIVSSHLLEHFQDPKPLLAEIKRLLTKDGYAVIAVPNENSPSKRKGHKICFPNIESLEQLLTENGFRIADKWTSPNIFVEKSFVVKIRHSQTPPARDRSQESSQPQ